MKRTTFDENRDQRIADDATANHRPCTTCSASTHADVLSDHGARCATCYAAYCAAINPAWWPNRPLTADERSAVIRKARSALGAIGNAKPSKQWALRLQARELAGERLSITQRAMWCAALGRPEAADGESA